MAGAARPADGARSSASEPNSVQGGLPSRMTAEASADAQREAYARIGVSQEDDDETALRKAETYLRSRDQVYRRMGSGMLEEAWAVATGNPLPAIGDIGHVEPALALLLGQLPNGSSWDAEQIVGVGPPPLGNCLVPGCGSGYAVAAFARSGRHAIGVEISKSAACAARAHMLDESLPVSSSALPGGSWTVLERDFFALSLQRVDVIYDATFLCSLLPEQRERWAAKCAELLDAQGELLTLIFPVANYEGGPPYAVSTQLLRSLLEPHGLRAMSMARVPPELRARPQFRGAEEWFARWRFGPGAARSSTTPSPPVDTPPGEPVEGVVLDDEIGMV